jgi:hypothetical protein
MFRDVSKDGISFIFRVKRLKCFQFTLLPQRNNHHNHLKVVISLYVPSAFTFEMRILTALYFFCIYMTITINGDYYKKRLFFTMNGVCYSEW